MREGDLVRITGKITSKIKDVASNLVGTYIGSSNLNNENIVEVLLEDGTIYRVKAKQVQPLSEEAINA